MDRNISFADRMLSVLTYFTFGMTGVIWLIAATLIFNSKISGFLKYHIFQSVFVSIILYAINLIFQIAYNFTAPLPFIGKIVQKLAVFVAGSPYHYTFSLWHFIIFLLVCYLSLGAILGKRTRLPYISSAISSSFGN